MDCPLIEMLLSEAAPLMSTPAVASAILMTSLPSMALIATTGAASTVRSVPLWPWPSLVKKNVSVADRFEIVNAVAAPLSVSVVPFQVPVLTVSWVRSMTSPICSPVRVASTAAGSASCSVPVPSSNVIV